MPPLDTMLSMMRTHCGNVALAGGALTFVHAFVVEVALAVALALAVPALGPNICAARLVPPLTQNFLQVPE
eukprot:41082-Eustigmatos_ZCMA.PRE.1